MIWPDFLSHITEFVKKKSPPSNWDDQYHVGPLRLRGHLQATWKLRQLEVWSIWMISFFFWLANFHSENDVFFPKKPYYQHDSWSHLGVDVLIQAAFKTTASNLVDVPESPTFRRRKRCDETPRGGLKHSQTLFIFNIFSPAKDDEIWQIFSLELKLRCGLLPEVTTKIISFSV